MKIRQRPGIPTNGDETRSVERSRTVESLALVAICIGYFMVILDATIVNVVAPVLQTQLGTTRTAVQWVIDGYLLMFASLLLTAGALGDHLGNKQVFLAGLLLFTTASAFCGFAPSIDILIAARFIQGIGAAFLVPPSLALLTGLALLPETGMVWLGNWLSGRVTARTGPRLPMVIGPLIGAAGFFSMCLADASTPYLVYCFMLMAIGFGMALNMPAMTNACIESAPRDRSSIASAVLNAGRQAGSALGVALLGMFVGSLGSFVPGMRVALVVAGAAFLAACALSYFGVHETKESASATRAG